MRTYAGPGPGTSIGSCQGSILQFIGAAGVEDDAFAQNAVDEPALFELENLLGECLAFVFCDWHGASPLKT